MKGAHGGVAVNAQNAPNYMGAVIVVNLRRGSFPANRTKAAL